MLELINSGWSIRIWHQWKNINGGTYKVCWEGTRGDITLGCNWFGFENGGKAIENMIKEVKAHTTAKIKLCQY